LKEFAKSKTLSIFAYQNKRKNTKTLSTMETQAIKTIQFGKFIATIHERSNAIDAKSYPYSVKFVQETPKARYMPYKVIYHYKFTTLERAEQQANAYINNAKSVAEYREIKRAAKAEANKGVNAADFYQIGDVIVNTWGYEQTNVNYYKVVKVTAKTISIVEIGLTTVKGSEYSHGMACNVTADLSNVLPNGDSFTLRVYEKGRLSNPESFYYMRKWSGEAQYNSWYY
jgi:hypothetical protein